MPILCESARKSFHWTWFIYPKLFGLSNMPFPLHLNKFCPFPLSSAIAYFLLNLASFDPSHSNALLLVYILCLCVYVCVTLNMSLYKCYWIVVIVFTNLVFPIDCNGYVLFLCLFCPKSLSFSLILNSISKVYSLHSVSDIVYTRYFWMN